MNDVNDLSKEMLLFSVHGRITAQEEELSSRTIRTREIGSHLTLKALLEGDWSLGTDYDRTILGRFLGKVIANAERQGVEVQKPE